jgi:hypothetical protein
MGSGANVAVSPVEHLRARGERRAAFPQFGDRAKPEW